MRPGPCLQARAAASAGVWGTAATVPGTDAFPQAPGSGWVTSVSCAKPGDCSAGGYYQDSAGNNQALVANEVNGTWHTAIEVPGTAALNRVGDASITSMSCTSPGNCSAGGQYFERSVLVPCWTY